MFSISYLWYWEYKWIGTSLSFLGFKSKQLLLCLNKHKITYWKCLCSDETPISTSALQSNTDLYMIIVHVLSKTAMLVNQKAESSFFFKKSFSATFSNKSLNITLSRSDCFQILNKYTIIIWTVCRLQVWLLTWLNLFIYTADFCLTSFLKWHNKFLL